MKLVATVKHIGEVKRKIKNMPRISDICIKQVNGKLNVYAKYK